MDSDSCIMTSPSTELSVVESRAKVKRRKPRRLATSEADSEEICSTASQHFLSRFSLATVVLIIFGISVVLLLSANDEFNIDKVVRDFRNSYRKHYYHIVLGLSDFCSPQLDTKTLFKQIRQQKILNQYQALKNLETTLRNASHLTSIAVVGPSGVGKSLTMRALEEYFPWRDNVHSYAWNTFVEEEVQKIRLLRLYVKKLSDCGRNLLVIDNLAPCDYGVVSILNELIRLKTAESVPPNQYTVVIYIFRINTLQPRDRYEEQYKMLQTLPDTKIINFKSFGRRELIECIDREASMQKLALKSKDYNEILNTIEPSSMGCKGVSAKILLYGQQEN